MKHGGSEGGGEVPSPSVLRKAKLWNDSIARNCWRNASWRDPRWSLLDVQGRRKVTMI